MSYTKTNWANLPSTTTPVTATNLNKIEDELESLDTGKVNTTDIINNLTSTETSKPLSANQGKVLKDYIDNVGYASDYGSVYPDNTNTGTTYKKYGSTITITTHGRPVVVMGTAFGRTTAGTVVWRVALDGNIITDTNLMGTNSTTNTRVVGFMTLSNVSAGTHTLQLAYACNFAENTATMVSYNNHSICAFEI